MRITKKLQSKEELCLRTLKIKEMSFMLIAVDCLAFKWSIKMRQSGKDFF